MQTVNLAPREATVAWQGDVVVLGAGLAGITAALATARAGRKTCLIEPNAVLGTEISWNWQNTVPPAPWRGRFADLCPSRGGLAGDRVDLLVTTLAFDRLLDEAGVFSVVRALPTRPLTDGTGRLIGVEIAGKSGRQAVRAPLVIDATPTRGFSRNVMGMPLPRPRSAARRLYVHGVDGVTADKVVKVARDLKLTGNAVTVLPTVWPGEVLVAFAQKLPARRQQASERLAATLAAGTALMTWLKTNVAEFAKATLVDV